MTELSAVSLWFDPAGKKAVKSAGRLSAVGWELAIAIIGSLLLGWWADKKLGTAPWLTLFGIVLGSCAGFWSLFRALKDANAEEDHHKVHDNGGGPEDPV